MINYHLTARHRDAEVWWDWERFCFFLLADSSGESIHTVDKNLRIIYAVQFVRKLSFMPFVVMQHNIHCICFLKYMFIVISANFLMLMLWFCSLSVNRLVMQRYVRVDCVLILVIPQSSSAVICVRPSLFNTDKWKRELCHFFVPLLSLFSLFKVITAHQAL